MRTSMTTQTTTEKKNGKNLRLTNHYVKVLQFAPIIIRTLWNGVDWWRRLDQTPPIHIINQITWVSAFVQTADTKAIPLHFRISRWFKLLCVSVLVVVGVRPAFVSDCVRVFVWLTLIFDCTLYMNIRTRKKLEFWLRSKIEFLSYFRVFSLRAFVRWLAVSVPRNSFFYFCFPSIRHRWYCLDSEHTKDTPYHRRFMCFAVALNIFSPCV